MFVVLKIASELPQSADPSLKFSILMVAVSPGSKIPLPEASINSKPPTLSSGAFTTMLIGTFQVLDALSVIATSITTMC